MEDTAANLTGDSKGAERRRGGGPTAIGRRIELWCAALVGDDGGRRRRRDADQENHQVLGKGDEEGRYRGGGILFRVEPRPGTQGPFVPFVPGCGSTRDKRYFWAGRENSQPAAHL